MSARVENCPECSGLGDVDGLECGTCLGDRVLLRQGATVPAAAEEDLTHGYTKFVDHSGSAHSCGRCRVRAGGAS